MTLRLRLSGRGATALAHAIEQQILEGRLQPGAALPTVRALAGELGVSPATVAAAYGRLQTRGLTAGGGRRGTRIRPLPPADELAALRDVSAAPTAAAEGLTDLASGNPDPDLLPDPGPALRAISTALHGYGDAAQLRALATFAAAEFAADGVAPDHLLVTGGGLDAVDRLLREHLRPGDGVALEDPTLPALLQLVSASGWQVMPVPVDAEGIRPEALAGALARRVRAVVVAVRAQNPTGAAITPPRAAELRRLLRDYREVLVIELDPAGPVSGAPALTLCDRPTWPWAVVRSVSKYLGPDLRVAVVAGDGATIARARRRQALGPRWVSYVLQRLVLALWSDPATGRLLARAAALYERRRRALTEALAAYGIEARAPSGFNVWVPVREELPVVQALAGEGWAVAAGEAFRVRAAPGIRVTVSRLPPEDAPRVAAVIAAVRGGLSAARG